MPHTRKRLFMRGVLVGYLALATQIGYSFASIPLALSYLSHAEFGLFSLVTTLVSYLNLAEMGMTNGFQRHLFECKDGVDEERYGRLFTAGLLALSLVSLVILLLGAAGAWFSAPFFQIPQSLLAEYRWLMLGLVAISAATMATRLLGSPLYIHQRQDLMQLSQIGTYVIFYGVLRYGLQSGWGVYALLANSLSAFVWGLGFNIIACLRLGLYPKRRHWALPYPEEWRSVRQYSKDIFMLQVGSKVAASLPMLLISRLLGLETVAAWTICSRPFFILKQLVIKPYDYALPMLCEIYVKGEQRRTARRWTHVTQLVVTLSICVFAIAAANNSLFIQLWTKEKMSWPATNHWLLAFYYLATVMGASAFGVVGFRKQMGHTRYIPYLEAALVLINAWWMTHLWGVSGLLLAAAIAPLAGSAYIGMHHIADITGISLRELTAKSILRPLLLLPFVATLAWLTSVLASLHPGYPGLMLAAGTGSLLVGTLGLFFGFSAEVRQEFLQLIQRPLRRIRYNTAQNAE